MAQRVQHTLYQVSTATALVEGFTKARCKSRLYGSTVIWASAPSRVWMVKWSSSTGISFRCALPAL